MQIVEFLEELNKLNEESIKTKVANIEFENIDDSDYSDGEKFDFDYFIFIIKANNVSKENSDVVFVVGADVNKSNIEVHYTNVGATYVPYGEGSTLWDDGYEIDEIDTSDAILVDDFIYKNINNEKLTKEQACTILGCSEKEFDSVKDSILDYIYNIVDSNIESDISSYID